MHNLEGRPMRLAHCTEYLQDEAARHITMEKTAHRIDEYHLY
jgi:hypothetical protein